MSRFSGYLSMFVPGVVDVDRVALDPAEEPRFRPVVEPFDEPARFLALGRSNGTLRASGVLVAVAQLADGEIPVRLVDIEEPETALHAAASAALMGAWQEAAVHTQVVVTTHSPDLLDRLDLDSNRLLAVQMRDGETEIGPINRASREAIEEHLFSPGELLRMGQFEPDWKDLERQRLAAGSVDAEKPA
jgi:predicted ATPase